jgi:predicted enzyme related to lactoylglutathione lyase
MDVTASGTPGHAALATGSAFKAWLGRRGADQHALWINPTNSAKMYMGSDGGFFPKKPDWPAQVPSVVIAVDDIKAAMGKVKAAGGEVLGEPMEIPGVGQYVSFTDSEGNRVSILQPLPRG